LLPTQHVRSCFTNLFFTIGPHRKIVDDWSGICQRWSPKRKSLLVGLAKGFFTSLVGLAKKSLPLGFAGGFVLLCLTLLGITTGFSIGRKYETSIARYEKVFIYYRFPRINYLLLRLGSGVFTLGPCKEVLAVAPHTENCHSWVPKSKSLLLVAAKAFFTAGAHSRMLVLDFTKNFILSGRTAKRIFTIGSHKGTRHYCASQRFLLCLNKNAVLLAARRQVFNIGPRKRVLSDCAARVNLY
jgi:hypothetical protein